MELGSYLEIPENSFLLLNFFCFEVFAKHKKKQSFMIYYWPGGRGGGGGVVVEEEDLFIFNDTIGDPGGPRRLGRRGAGEGG